jgi:pyridinium-3,5-bisthiocarboxylic acid mononucleotide nickel chelatase
VSRILYIDCVGGAAGDMLLAALLHSGADPEPIRSALRSLHVEAVGLELERAERHGIGALRARVVQPDERTHRTWADVRELLAAADLPGRAREHAELAFRRLAEAEGRIHGVAPDDVHFHEVGALDAIAEICGVALAIEQLGIDRVVSSPLPLARGFVRAAHGRLPLPAPATLELLRGVPVYGLDLDVELVTPTGAALVRALASSFGTLPAMRPELIGYGAGSRDTPEIPNLVRVVVGAGVEPGHGGTVVLMEANLDDLSPELVPDAVEACFDAGALDVWTAPVQMKKGRPGIVLSALARPGSERPVVEAIVRGTTTLGVRTSRLQRWELEREQRTIEVYGRSVTVKLGLLDGRVVNVAPEHDDCAAVARATGRTVKAVWSEAFAVAQREAGA